MKSILTVISILVLAWGSAGLPTPTENLLQPQQPVKLVFIHHSTGENWLTDGYGDLGRTLDQNNYFVSDTNYGWGPDGIGDRTDIPDWVEWFRSDQTDTYMQALFAESGQHASYTRTLHDPGGENQIILFKSCFPNSDLAGSPQDPPGDYAELSVSGAKYVYNEILKYFAVRPDKMFVVITAPPLSDRAHADNARAFNMWLVNDWLKENNYAGGNVFVYDFYNVLTGPDAHHFMNNGVVEHVVGKRNTLYYPSGDDHPSIEGSLKATAEFVPVLNYFYQQWKSGNPTPAGNAAATEAPGTTQAAPIVPPPPQPVGTIDDFEGEAFRWETYQGEASGTSITCQVNDELAKSGGGSLLIAYEVPPESWATCVLFFDTPVDWRAADALAFDLLADTSTFEVSLYLGADDARQTYLHPISTLPVTAEVWVPYELRWEEFHRADWEENAGTPLAEPAQISGIAFGFSPVDGDINSGQIRVDNLHLSSRTGTADAPASPVEEPTSMPASPPANPASRLPFCGMGILLPMMMALMIWRWKFKV